MIDWVKEFTVKHPDGVALTALIVCILSVVCSCTSMFAESASGLEKVWIAYMIFHFHLDVLIDICDWIVKQCKDSDE